MTPIVSSPSDDVIALHERHARHYDADRDRSLSVERGWLDRFVSLLPARGTILDVGCGHGEPIARYLIDNGFEVTGVDSSPSMIARCRERFPDHEWFVADMRRLALGETFQGLIAWDSFFFLAHDEQRAMFPIFNDHAEPGAALLFTSGTSHGERIGSYRASRSTM